MQIKLSIPRAALDNTFSEVEHRLGLIKVNDGKHREAY
jgi:hypothetical protein